MILMYHPKLGAEALMHESTARVMQKRGWIPAEMQELLNDDDNDDYDDFLDDFQTNF